MSTLWKILAGVAVLALAAVLAVQSGFARTVFYELFAYVKGDELVAPTVQRRAPRNSPYQVWLERARTEIPVFEGLVIDDVNTVALPAWPQLGTGVHGLYLHFADYQMSDGRLVELPPQGSTAGQRHLYEKAVYVISGSGYTVLQQEGQPMQRVDWNTGDLFSIPLNVAHQHHNPGDEPARLLMVTSFPLMLNVMNSEQFITRNKYAFTDRYDGSPGYLELLEQRDEYELLTNFVDDIRTTATRRNDFRGRGNSTARWQMAGNSMLSMHVSEMPPRMYKKAHRHTSDALILLLSGKGFSVTWREGAYDERVRVDWQPGTLFVPPMYWYHQHLNTGSTPARYLAINVPTLSQNIGLRFEDQLEVDNEEVVEEWRQELKKVATEQ